MRTHTVHLPVPVRVALALLVLAALFVLSGCAPVVPETRLAVLPALPNDCIVLTSPRPRLDKGRYTARRAAVAYSRLARRYDKEGARADACRYYVRDVWRAYGSDTDVVPPTPEWRKRASLASWWRRRKVRGKTAGGG